MNVIDFIRESAAFMAADRTDIYTPDLAVRELAEAIHVLRQGDSAFGNIMFTSYVLSRMVEDGVEEFLLSRKLSSVLLCEEEDTCIVFAHTDEVMLPSVNDVQPDEYLDETLDEDDETW